MCPFRHARASRCARRGARRSGAFCFGAGREQRDSSDTLREKSPAATERTAGGIVCVRMRRPAWAACNGLQTPTSSSDISK